jgi:hypothetical protein
MKRFLILVVFIIGAFVAFSEQLYIFNGFSILTGEVAFEKEERLLRFLMVSRFNQKPSRYLGCLSLLRSTLFQVTAWNRYTKEIWEDLLSLL